MPQSPTINFVRVAIAVIFDAEGESVLIGQRTDKQPLGGYWEFPGGKCDAGETPEECLIREVREETGIEVEILKPWPPIDYTYTHAAVRIFPFICRHKSGHPQPFSSQKLLWIPVQKLSEYSFPSANEGLLQEVLRGFQHLIR
jgi:mutator protein MutT